MVHHFIHFKLVPFFNAAYKNKSNYLGIIKHNVGKDKVITTQKVIEMNSFARYELRMQTLDVKEKKKNSYFLYFWQEKLIYNTRSTIYKI